MKKIYLIRILSFFAVIILLVGTMNFKSEQISSIDNRKLTEASEIRNGDITDNVEKYVSDRIGFRTEMINLYTKGMDVLFGEMIHPSYQYGKDGYIFGKLSKEQSNSEFQEVYSDLILTIQNYCSEKNIDFLYVLEPAKTVVYQEELPNGYVYSRYNTEYLLELLEEKNINYLDNTEILLEAKENGIQVFDRKYDANHWNENGALIGMAAILDKLNSMNEEVAQLDYNMFDQISYTNTSLPVSYFAIDEETYHYSLINDHSTLIDFDKSTIELSSEYRNFEYYVNESNSSAPKILVFAGSYFTERDQYLTENFSEYIRIHNYYNVINYDYYIDMFKPDIVLFESTEFTHSNTFFPIERMKEAVGSIQ